MFNQLIELKNWAQDNPVKAIKPLKTKELERRHLSTEEIKELLEKLEQSKNPSAVKITKICLATGARWSEVENLTKSQVGNDRITFINTKGGKNRTVPLSAELCEELKNNSNEQLFRESYYTFRKTLKKCVLR